MHKKNTHAEVIITGKIYIHTYIQNLYLPISLLLMFFYPFLTSIDSFPIYRNMVNLSLTIIFLAVKCLFHFELVSFCSLLSLYFFLLFLNKISHFIYLHISILLYFSCPCILLSFTCLYFKNLIYLVFFFVQILWYY